MNRKLKGKIVEKFGSQWEFAQAVHEHESNVSRIIRGRRELSGESKKVWADALGEELAVLFDFEAQNGR